jgi:hypothetical protein
MFLIKVDTAEVMDRLTGMEQVQLPFAMSLALNRIANAAQAAEQAHLKAKFKLRRPAWNLQGIYISKADRATKSSWRVVVQVQPTRDYLSRMEEGGEKTPTRGRWLWKPNAEVFKNKIILRSDPLHPLNLRFHKQGRSHQFQGNERTFMIAVKGLLLVLQRVDRRLTKQSARRLGRLTLDTFRGGQGPSLKRERVAIERTVGTRLLYTLVSRVRVPRKLEFVNTISRTVQTQWPAVFADALGEAMRTAR